MFESMRQAESLPFLEIRRRIRQKLPIDGVATNSLSRPLAEEIGGQLPPFQLLFGWAV